MDHNLSPYAPYLATLLPAGGFALQWMRQHAKITEVWTVVWALLIAFGVYFLCLDWAHLPSGIAAVQKAILDWVVWMVVALPAVIGGTAIADGAANTGKLPIIPVANSK